MEVNITLQEYLNSICNWCERQFSAEPIYNDELKIYAFCSKKCADEAERYELSLHVLSKKDIDLIL